MGEVFLAEHERLPGLFAVKCLQSDLLDQDEILARFRREAEIVAGLRHPNVVQVFDFNVTPTGTPYLVMEYLDGEDLASVIKSQGPMQPGDVMAIVKQVGEALEAAHALGIVHRDLKPENVVLMRLAGKDADAISERLVKVIDFGISVSASCPRITGDASVLGTPHFMSPEQAQGRRDQVDARADQFALAVMTYMMLSGQSPFRGETPLAVIYNAVHEDPRSLAEFPSKLLPQTTAAIDAVLRRGMARDREDRFASVAAIVQELQKALAPPDEMVPALPGPTVDVEGPTPPAVVWDARADAVAAPEGLEVPTIVVRRKRRIFPVAFLVTAAFVLAFAMVSSAAHVTVDDVTQACAWVLGHVNKAWALAFPR
jgi:serine/threonine-protein kinase